MLGRFFVYGTLRTGALDPRVDRFIARHGRWLGPARAPGRLYDLGPYPGATEPQRAGEVIEGQVLAVRWPRRALAILDAYEGADPGDPAGPFRREQVTVTLAGGRRLTCWIYRLRRLPPMATHLPEGRWGAAT